MTWIPGGGWPILAGSARVGFFSRPFSIFWLTAGCPRFVVGTWVLGLTFEVKQAFGLLFYILNRMNLPPVSADFGVVSRDAYHCNGLTDLRHTARHFGYALGHN